MRLVLVRHAEAEPGSPDELRTLTDEGRAQARALGERLRGEGIHPDAVLSSPLLRAVQTAELLGLGEPEADERLAPGMTAETARAVVQEHGGTVVVVGHQPDCSRIAGALTDGVEPPFPPAGVAVIEL
jgi:phosphohistidine phosphatase